jgi:hypothetical protein
MPATMPIGKANLRRCSLSQAQALSLQYRGKVAHKHGRTQMDKTLARA